MIRKEKNGLQWLEFEILQEFSNLNHAVFTRHGGHSKETFATLNFGFHLGDPHHNVIRNFDQVKHTFHFKNYYYAQQVHLDTVVSIDHSSPIQIPQCDALITKESNRALFIRHADCQAILLYDPKQNVIANIHCGWRGSVANIIKKIVQQLKQDYHCRPQDLLACISPSLGPQSAEFIHYQTELPIEFHKYMQEKHHFDFWAVSHRQLLDMQVVDHHIEIAGIDTKQSQKDFFSFRIDSDCGRNATFISLK